MFYIKSLGVSGELQLDWERSKKERKKDGSRRSEQAMGVLCRGTVAL